jgi:mxaJ protein
VATRAIAVALAIAWATTAEARSLRVCADPNNLPFSNRAEEGFENALAGVLAHALDAELIYTWLPQRRGFVRNTLNADRCDVMIEAPVGFARAATTRPYFRSSYVFVTRRDRRLDLRSLDDPRLRKLRIGVQVIGDDYANTPPATALARRGLSPNVRGYSVYGDYGSAAPLAPIVEAVAHGDVDVALVWGPIAGYFAQRSKVPLSIASVQTGKDDPPFEFAIGLGLRHKDDGLREELEHVLSEHEGEVAAVLKRYGVPVLRP